MNPALLSLVGNIITFNPETSEPTERQEKEGEKKYK